MDRRITSSRYYSQGQTLAHYSAHRLWFDAGYINHLLVYRLNSSMNADMFVNNIRYRIGSSSSSESFQDYVPGNQGDVRSHVSYSQ